MQEERIQPRPYLTLLLAALLGIVSAVMTFVFVAVVNGGQTLIWQQAAQTTGLPLPIFTLLVCTLGGLVVGVLVKLLITPMCLATGWKGGYIFPTMFAGTALGLAVHGIFPDIPVAVAVAATVAGSLVAIFKAPIWSALFVLLFVQQQTSPVVAIAVIVGLLATTRFSIVQPPKPAAQSASPATAPASPAAGA